MQLNIEQLKNTDAFTSIKDIAVLMDGLTKHKLECVPWEQYNYLPAVSFAIAYNNEMLFLKYEVTERYVRAVNTAINSSVWEDSCVEFFISFDDKAYYNFEFNCIGTALVGYGQTKNSRELLPEILVSQVNCQAVINNQQGNYHWELTIAIPLKTFCFNTFNTLTGKKCRANFYKCGDKLPAPHFITWSPILSEKPNFHLPEFFGHVVFM